MNLNDLTNTVLVLVFLFGVAAMIGMALRREASHDGQRRPLPRSHRAEEVESRSRVLQRLS